jgi:general secretion pathway protein B
MSFILDALKKSENDRQRQSGPALFEVRVAPPRPRFPPWALAVVGLLVVNVGVIGWLMLRKPAVAASQRQPSAATAQQPIAAPREQTAPPPQYSAPPAQAGVQPQGYPPPQQQFGPPQQQQYGPPQQYAPTQQQYAPPQPTYGPPPQPGANFQGTEPQLADSRGAQESTNPDDYAPATETSASQPLGHARRGTESGLPTYEEAASKIGVPQLRLDLHVYAPDPRKRFIMLNMKRLGEGDSLPEGVKVDSITNDGAILSYHGSRFVLERE